MFKSSIFRLFALVAFGLVVAGCAPRGETDTLAGVLATSKSNFSQAANSVSDAALKDRMKSVAETLESMIAKDANGSTVARGSEAVAVQFNELINKAGYTTRASMNEIALQHRTLSQEASKGEVSQARVKLLVARTYSLLASELETTKFAL